MQTFNANFGLRQLVMIKITGQQAITVGVHIRDMNTPRYDLLFLTPIDSIRSIRTELTVDEYEIGALPDGTARTFPDPFISTAIGS